MVRNTKIPEWTEVLQVAFLLLPSVDFCCVKVRMRPPSGFLVLVSLNPPATLSLQVCHYMHDTHCLKTPWWHTWTCCSVSKLIGSFPDKIFGARNKTKKDAHEGRWLGGGAKNPHHPKQMKNMRFMWVQWINYPLLLIASYVWISKQWFTPAARPFVLM